ncbi:MAG: DUF547 domain-containing protein [Caldilineae bacterium]|nr:MAG: DUF547 domain-containing protein [Caldilineae bacterium]
MPITEGLISIRDTLLDGILGISGRDVLNAGQPPIAHAGADTAGEIRRAANAFKAAAVDASGTRVDYQALRQTPAYAEFRRICTPMLRAFDPSSLSGRRERLAFWINLYNVLIIDAVIAYGIETSVAEGPLGLLRFFRRAAYVVGGLRVSAEDIEHGILRANAGHPYLPGPQFASRDPRMAWVISPPDPRIHFALNCASRSCPPIAVYDAGRLDAQLDMAAASFITQTLRVDVSRGEVWLSPIFRWYDRDFGGKAGVLETLVRHLPLHDERRALLQDPARLRIRYLPYDWSLNI